MQEILEKSKPTMTIAEFLNGEGEAEMLVGERKRRTIRDPEGISSLPTSYNVVDQLKLTTVSASVWNYIKDSDKVRKELLEALKKGDEEKEDGAAAMQGVAKVVAAAPVEEKGKEKEAPRASNLFFQIPQCDVYLGKHRVTAIVDSGALQTALSHVIARKLGLLPYIQDTTIEFTTSSGETSKPWGILLDVPVRVGKLTLPVDIAVTGANTYDTLLGRDWIYSAKADILTSKGKIVYQVPRFRSLSPASSPSFPQLVAFATPAHRDPSPSRTLRPAPSLPPRRLHFPPVPFTSPPSPSLPPVAFTPRPPSPALLRRGHPPQPRRDFPPAIAFTFSHPAAFISPTTETDSVPIITGPLGGAGRPSFVLLPSHTTHKNINEEDEKRIKEWMEEQDFLNWMEEEEEKEEASNAEESEEEEEEKGIKEAGGEEEETWGYNFGSPTADEMGAWDTMATGIDWNRTEKGGEGRIIIGSYYTLKKEAPRVACPAFEDLPVSLNHEKGEQQQKEVRTLLVEYRDIFSTEETLGTHPTIRHHISIGNAKPIPHKPYRVSPSERARIEEEVSTLLKKGVIHPSNSPWSSLCIVIPKKDFRDRVVIDYRPLNAVTEAADQFPMPRIDDILDKTPTKSAYHTILVAEEDVLKTAFVTSTGQYEYTWMPFGLKNAPATFQCLMTTTFRTIPTPSHT
ncbi:unnamed protein product [Closterium sp. Yama58-4]|nr:unnamed protein product [Closterium sp. Yama58-4]